jgi:hypothetical protein
MAKMIGYECQVIKIGFEKVCCLVDYGFLDYMLGRFRFRDKWI